MFDSDLSEFLMRASHDLRAAMRAIRVHAELLRRDGHAPEIPSFEERVGFIVDGIGTIESLADELSGYSIALQTEETSFLFIQMGAVLRTALAKIERQLREQGVEVTYGGLPRVFGDPDRLAQLFQILIGNALRRHAAGACALRLHIAAEKQADDWLFSVREILSVRDGRGLDVTVKVPDLAICRMIVERHGGCLWEESKPEIGTRFLFTLPAISQPLG